MPIDFFRVDDRLIHGQVIVGWAQPLGVQLIVLVDDDVAGSDWERELYSMAVPRGIELRFDTVSGAAERFADYRGDPRRGMLLTRDVATMAQLRRAVPSITAIHIGGLHYGPGRTQRLRYVFLSEADERLLRSLAEEGLVVTAQDVPTARAISLADLLAERKTG
jgi:mannose/fructose/N-acetylgalactosamine-specific phosphotransferase system component IIB